jgi:NAD(P)-dependent dehydrogenase (short-subunit alcohol dehydrogenase family)
VRKHWEWTTIPAKETITVSSSPNERPTALIVGASRGLGHAIAAELFDRGWNVVGTVRDASARTLLHDLADRSGGRVTVEVLDITAPAQLAPLHERLTRTGHDRLDLLFVNAGTTSHPQTPIGRVPTDDFIEVMVTNALSPLRVIEALHDLVAPAGLIGVMSSGQGSIANNAVGQRELYRGSKAALNMFMRSYAVRQADTKRGFVLMAPGWIQTGLGGPDAPFTMEQNVPKVVDVLLAKLGRPGLEYLDYKGETVPW